jgi:protein-S-isoprenylcysteine O-methyltransferase Ste14
MTTALSALAARRIMLTRLLFIPLLAYIVLTPPWTAGVLGLLGETLGYACLVVATFGRVWCLTYIGGYKRAQIITEGPYSVVRNPLYLFTLIGGAGFGLATEHLAAAVVMLGAFGVYYPFVVAKEERILEQLHGDAYREYTRRTPRWIPNFRRFTEPETWQVKPAFIRRSILSSMWFLWLYLAWIVIEQLHALAILPGWQM